MPARAGQCCSLFLRTVISRRSGGSRAASGQERTSDWISRAAAAFAREAHWGTDPVVGTDSIGAFLAFSVCSLRPIFGAHSLT